MNSEEMAQNTADKMPQGMVDFFEMHGIAPVAVVRMAAVMLLIVCMGLGAIGVAAYRSSVDHNRETAFRRLHGSTTAEQIREVMDNYEVAGIAPIAMLKLANAQHSEGSYELAHATYDDFLREYAEHPLALTAELGKIVCIESQGGMVEQAMAGYTDFASRHADSFLGPEAVFGRGRCFEQMGRFEDARQLYEDFIVQYPDSRWVERAEQLLAAVNVELRRAAKTL